MIPMMLPWIGCSGPTVARVECMTVQDHHGGKGLQETEQV